MVMLQPKLIRYLSRDDVLRVGNLSQGSGMEAEESQSLHEDDINNLKPQQERDYL